MMIDGRHRRKLPLEWLPAQIASSSAGARARGPLSGADGVEELGPAFNHMVSPRRVIGTERLFRAAGHGALTWGSLNG